MGGSAGEGTREGVAARAGENGETNPGCDLEGTGNTWARVVRGGKGKRGVALEGQPAGGGEGVGNEEADEHMDGNEEDGASEDGLPPVRVFVPPSEPREAILRKAEAAAARARRAEQQGAKEEKVRRTKAEAELMARKLREAGGASATTLLFQIKAEERKKEQSSKAIEQLQKQILDEEEEILNKRLAIQKLQKAVERHEGRREASERRLAYLAAQKHSESMPLVDVTEIRGAASRLAASGLEGMAPLLDLCARLAPPQCHDLGEGDTSGTEDGSRGSTTEEEMDEDGASKHINWADYEGGYAQQLREAKEELEQKRRVMLAAVEAARREKGGATKRPLGGDGPREEDGEGDIEMVPSLTPAQVEEFHKSAIRAVAQRFRHLQTLAAKEMAGGAGGGGARPQQQRRQGGPSEEASAATQPQMQPRAQGAAAEAGEQRERGERPAARPLQRAASSGTTRPAAHCVSQWQTAEDRDAERGRWRSGGSGVRGRSSAPRGGAERGRGRMAQREVGGEGRSGDPAPVTPVDPQAARDVAEEIGRVRGEIESRMGEVVLQVETNAAAEVVKRGLEAKAAISSQERMQLLQEVEFAAACSRRASEAGLQTEWQTEQVRQLWIAEMARVGEGQLAEAAFATYGPTGLPLEEQQRAHRRAIRAANLGEGANRGYVAAEVQGGSGADVDGRGQGQRALEEEAHGGRSRSKSPRPRGGTRARRE